MFKKKYTLNGKEKAGVGVLPPWNAHFLIIYFQTCTVLSTAQMFVHSFIHSFQEHLFSAGSMPVGPRIQEVCVCVCVCAHTG